MVAIVPDGDSPLGPAWRDVFHHVDRRLWFTDNSFQLATFTASEASSPAAPGARMLQDALTTAQVVLATGDHSEWLQQVLEEGTSEAAAVLVLEAPAALSALSRLGSTAVGRPSPLQTLSSKLPFTAASTALRLYSTSRVFWDRRTSDDLLYLLLILVNEYVQEVPLVSGIIRAPGPSSLYCMLTKCGGEIIACQSDASCKSALDCLDGCPLNDQVCQYRCIVSYESQQLEAFSLCILQKHNCLNNNAQIPALPDPAPLPSFQGQPLTHELAERIFIGGLEASPGGCDTSWKVVAGRNPAYDYFPCQNQLFYPAKTARSMWYDPVFKVKTLDDRQVWRRRHYRVRRGKAPGTFHFSVLDNGVMSNEFWRILACADDYSWGVFFYSGAASRAGLAYEGALVVTQDGNWPADEHVLEQIRNILDGAGIKMWEMHSVDNSACSGSPLGLPDFAPPLLEAAVQRAAA